jgi:hypothetical protein
MDGSGKVDLSDINWSDVPKHRMTPEAIRTLTYFLMTEGSTFFYVKALMKTKACFEEPELAPFLCVWMYEEEFHGRAFRKFLEAYGVDVPETYRSDMFMKRSFGEKFDEIGQVAVSRMFPNEWPAVHMTWGVIQEYTTYCAYQALIDRINHPILNVICQRIMKQELKHYAFYKEHARKRLVNNPRAQKVTTYALKLAWTPVGDGMCEKEESIHAIQFLFDGVHGSAPDLIDRKTRELPGLEWFDLFTRFTRDHKIGKAPREWFPDRVNLDSPEGAIAAE